MATTGRNGRPSAATPEEIEAERKQTEDQSVAEDGDAVDIRRELVERQQHHDNDDDGRPEVGPSPAAGNVARPYRSPSALP